MRGGLDYEQIPESVEQAIMRKHDHEGPANRPLWLIWKIQLRRDGAVDDTALSSVADSADNARYAVASLMGLYLGEIQPRSENHCFVERVPANHSFASSLDSAVRAVQIRHFRGKA